MSADDDDLAGLFAAAALRDDIGEFLTLCGKLLPNRSVSHAGQGLFNISGCLLKVFIKNIIAVADPGGQHIDMAAQLIAERCFLSCQPGCYEAPIPVLVLFRTGRAPIAVPYKK